MPLPSLNRLRKGVVSFFILIFFFILYHLLFFKTASDFVLLEKSIPNVYTEMCLLVTSGGPVNIDTVFNLKNGGVNKIFAYSILVEDFDTSVVLWHEWYSGSKMVKNVRCKMENSACYSSISIDSLQAGEWSVDIKQNDNLLLDIKQFKIDNF